MSRHGRLDIKILIWLVSSFDLLEEPIFHGFLEMWIQFNELRTFYASWIDHYFLSIKSFFQKVESKSLNDNLSPRITCLNLSKSNVLFLIKVQISRGSQNNHGDKKSSDERCYHHNGSAWIGFRNYVAISHRCNCDECHVESVEKVI